ncbi:HEPN domain-containing protein [Rhodanobacter sp. B2A1Ga4]|uniref:HEPN domain-containing protein n=1 Tax=Rhodanobacter sp. B2A1Ga4 TaxID=2778647 RepID=UPI001B389949|nr:HEPN domain-containing protein [Rhodanobacter sp. B2A1Ga4]MBQ4856189.1 HEPN domain-containing protein [Rhodanobacter sp. B2A1Ga4]
MDALRRMLMLRESLSWTEAANTLTESGEHFDAATLLRLLAFELALKALVEQYTTSQAPKHHRYAEIFKLLPDDIQRRLLEVAGERIGPSRLGRDANAVLEELGENFKGLRYPWERYAGLSEEQYSRLGQDWIAAGAQTDHAAFRFYPEELFGLTYAARHLAGC